MAHSQTHVFYLYVGNLIPDRPPAIGETLILSSKELAHRIVNVLRLREGEILQLCSPKCVLTVRLAPSARPKDTICALITEIEKITLPQHSLVAATGLLKKESFEEAVHHATVTGATHIVPLITTKSRKGWLHEREKERLQDIIIAACEQSKNRYIPALLEPTPLAKSFSLFPTTFAIGLEAAKDQNMQALVASLTEKKPSHITLFTGPEGGFTIEEIDLMAKHQTNFYRLTPTILRSQEAVCVAMGLIRAIID